MTQLRLCGRMTLAMMSSGVIQARKAREGAWWHTAALEVHG